MNNKMLIAYLNSEGCSVSEEQAKMLTHVNFAFGHMAQDLSIDVTRAPMLTDGTVQNLRKWNPDLKLILSLVGPVWSDACKTEEGLRTIAENCAQAVLAYDLDGVDFDWEYPCVPSNGVPASPEDKHNFTLLLKTTRERLDAIEGDRHYLVTIAAGADVYYCENVEMEEIVKYLDFINVMTYDLKCGFHALSGHHTSLFCTPGDYFHNSCARALKVFESYGVPRDKLLLGAGFYSRKWENVPDVNHGMLQLTKTGGGYGPAYHELLENYINKNGFVRYWDEYAQAPWLFDGSTFISYDDEQSLAAKCRYVLDQDYAGIFYWNHSDDNTGRLLSATYQALKG